ncbi:hypothetical protein ACHAXT_010776 [Thalassiosira profunda]
MEYLHLFPAPKTSLARAPEYLPALLTTAKRHESLTMGVFDTICETGIEEGIMDSLRYSKFGHSGIEDFLDQFTADELDAMEAKCCGGPCPTAYSLAFHTLLQWKLAKAKCMQPFDPEENPIMMKTFRLKIREELLSLMEELNGKEFEREKISAEEEQKMVREAWKWSYDRAEPNLTLQDKMSYFAHGGISLMALGSTDTAPPPEKKAKK